MAHWRLPAAATLVAIPLLALFIFLDGSSPRSQPPRPNAAALLRQLPLSFEENRGQTDERVRYVAHGQGYTVFLTDRESVVSLKRGKSSTSLRMRFVGATHNRPTAERRRPGTVNVFRGTREHWRTGIGTYARVRQRLVYPGIDALFHGRGRQFEYDFNVRPGADPADITVALDGARKLRLAQNGDLLVDVPGGTLRQLRPVAYQTVDGRRTPVSVDYALHGSKLGFRLGDYDRSRPLVIDPTLSYSSYLGGSGRERGLGVGVDSTGNVYLTGFTGSTDFPRKAGRAGTSHGNYDLYVTKINPSSSTMIYSDLISGSGTDEGIGMAVDSAGNAYVTGYTSSGSTGNETFPFPTTSGVVQTSDAGVEDAFVFKLNPSGTTLLYSTYLGGTGVDIASAIAIDSSGNAYVTGYTQSSNFAGIGAGSLDSTLEGGEDAFLTKLNPSGTQILFSTLLGGSGVLDQGIGVAVDPTSDGSIYVAGFTNSTTFPGVSNGVAQHTIGGGIDGFVTKFDKSGSSIAYSTYIGGTDTDFAAGVAVNSSHQAYVVGSTTWTSNNFPLTNALYDQANNDDAFLAKLNSDGTAFLFNTYLGGRTASDPGGAYPASGDDYGLGVTLDTAESPYVTGYTAAGTSFSPFLGQTNADAAYTAYVAKFKPDGTKLAWARVFGGGANDYARAVAVEPNGNVWVTGNTVTSAQTNDFPVLGNAVQETYGGDSTQVEGDAFIVEYTPDPASITSGTSGTVKSGDVSFVFSSPNSADTFKCKVGNEAEATCTSPYQRTLVDGTYTFSVQAYDAGDTPDGPAAKRTFTVDSTPPSAFDLTEPAEGATTTVRPTFKWQAPADASALSFQLLIDGQKQQDVNADACSGGTCSVEAAAAIRGGQHTWKVVATDVVGNSTASTSTRGFLVSAAPTASFTVAPNPVLADRTVSFDASASTPGSDPIAKYEWDLDGDGSFETDGGASPTFTKSYASGGTFKVGLRVTDAIGQTGTATRDLVVTQPVIGGSQVGVSINKGAQYTNKPDVTLSIVPPGSVTALLVANDGGFTGIVPQAVASEVKWRLDSSGPERLPKTVYVRFLSGPFASPNYTDDIILDERPPVVDSASVVGGASSAAVRVAKLRTFKVKVKARDSNSGVAGVQVAVSKKKPGKLLKYKKTVTTKLASRPKFIRAKDRAGNYSKWRKLR